MLLTKFSYFFTLLILISLFQSHILASKKSYIVYLGEHSHGAGATAADLQLVTESHHNLLSSFLGSKAKAKESIFYSYKRVINGFAAVLEEDEVAQIAKHPDVLSVFPNEGVKLHTTHSWEFLNLEKNGVIHHNSLWKKARFGEDVIIANLDTGVWPESKSFNDDGFGPVPSKWKGICQNDNGANFTCNRKLIGARYFNKGYLAYAKEKNISLVFDETIGSPRDHNGHGSHTLSTAAGSFVPGANVYGFGNGTAKGGSPKALVATYKVCWPPIDQNQCFDADIMKAFDMAIHDGVDVLSISLGTKAAEYSKDVLAIGAFHAVNKGIVVVGSAGNNGPEVGTVGNVAPWIITVGASTIDREFQAYVRLQNGLSLKGMSLSRPMAEERLYPLVTLDQAKTRNDSEAAFCPMGAFDPKKLKGKILVCRRGCYEGLPMEEQAARAGAAGMILCNDEVDGNEIRPDRHVLPTTHINYTDGLLVFKYVNSTIDPSGYITPPTTQLNSKPAPVISSFSSRGPNSITPEILKPDISAPGYKIIAAFSEGIASSEEESDDMNLPFNMISGTSMACPHISGIVGLLKTLHPDWSPAAIRSAIMTTARTRDNNVEPILDNGYTPVNSTIQTRLAPASPFSYGAGLVRPNRAMNPGLVYDLTINDYLSFLCYNKKQLKVFSNEPYKCPDKLDLLSFNNPSITVPKLGSGLVTVSRTVKNVGGPGNYTARIRNPPGVSVSVEPSVLQFEKIGEEKTFKLSIEARKLHANSKAKYVFGQLIWSDGSHFVRSPIVVGAT
ncbi:hypothetical protein Leryth_020164 [Lithospermum erythrorhizon]|nr:hypothetical protein Leryth_020164 [Lithospermum erythrorhizon]